MINISLKILQKLPNYAPDKCEKKSPDFNYERSDTRITDIKTVYSNNQAYLAVSRDDVIITWGEKTCGGGRLIDTLKNNIKCIIPSKYTFFILTFDGNIYVLGDIIWEKTANTKYFTNIMKISVYNETIYAINYKNKLVWWSYVDKHKTYISY